MPTNRNSVAQCIRLPPPPRRAPAGTLGFTLVELLISLTLGLGLIAAALHMYQLAMQAYRTTEAVASLEERAAFALQAMAADIELAGFPGAAGEAATVPVPGSAWCGGTNVSTWALNPLQPVAAVDGGLDAPCPAFTRPVAGSDSLTVRHYAAQSSIPTREAHSWYVDAASSIPTQPSLRRFTLLPDGRIQNQEIIPGVETLQVQLGIDSDADGMLDSFVTPSAAASAPVLAVQVRLQVRAAAREPGLGGDGIRRISAQRFFYLRNHNAAAVRASLALSSTATNVDTHG